MAGWSPAPAKNAPARAFCHFNRATFTIAEEAANVIDVGVQLLDARGRPLPAGQLAHVTAYLSDDAAGADITAVVPTSGLAATVGSMLAEIVNDKMAIFQTNGSGSFTVRITQTAAQTYYLCLLMPDGSIIVSSSITFAA